jgi:hypothetical protein
MAGESSRAAVQCKAQRASDSDTSLLERLVSHLLGFANSFRLTHWTVPSILKFNLIEHVLRTSFGRK